MPPLLYMDIVIVYIPPQPDMNTALHKLHKAFTWKQRFNSTRLFHGPSAMLTIHLLLCNSSTIVKTVDDTVVVDLISDHDKKAYLEDI